MSGGWYDFSGVVVMRELLDRYIPGLRAVLLPNDSEVMLYVQARRADPCRLRFDTGPGLGVEPASAAGEHGVLRRT